ncbi:MAG: hypothetical protein IT558_00300 [Alphaproteobacteria bacterium]|nr:hypothetical protein [Alphaproteobacteria bacterium]
MRVDLKKMMEKLGVNDVLSAYETHPWLHYDPGKGITCSAEVRVGPGMEDIEAEIQFLYDEGKSGENGEGAGGMPVQIMRMRALPADNLWSPKELRVKAEDYVNKIHNWEEKGCNFFRACVESLQMSEIPDIEALIARELDDDDGFGGGRGRIGRKAPKIKPAALLGMKKGM